MNWTGYGGVQINGSNYYSSTSQNATVSTQAYGGLLEVSATNGCGTSPSITYVVGTPSIHSTVINGSLGSTATVPWVASLYLNTWSTATSANWSYTNGSGSLSPYGTSCNAYPSNFLRVVSTATNSNGSGQEATFYIFKEGYSPYGRAYPNPAKDKVTLDFEDALLAEELLTSISLIDEDGKPWRNFNAQESNNKNHFRQNKGVSFDLKGIPSGTYYLHIYLADKIYKERILID